MTTHAKDFGRKAAIILGIGAAVAATILAPHVLLLVGIKTLATGSLAAYAAAGGIGLAAGVLGGGLLGGMIGGLFKRKEPGVVVSTPGSEKMGLSAEKARSPQLVIEHEVGPKGTYHQDVVSASRATEPEAARTA